MEYPSWNVKYWQIDNDQIIGLSISAQNEVSLQLTLLVTLLTFFQTLTFLKIFMLFSSSRSSCVQHDLYRIGCRDDFKKSPLSATLHVHRKTM